LLTEAADDEEESAMGFTRKAVDVLVGLLEDTDLDLVVSKPAQDIQDVPAPGVFALSGKTNGELKLEIVCEMWRIKCEVFQEANLRRAGERLLSCLMKIEDELVESNDEARQLWVSLCVKALTVCDVDAIKMFWGFERGWDWDWTEEVRNTVWRSSIEKWSDGNCNWEGAAVLLAVPFVCVILPGQCLRISVLTVFAPGHLDPKLLATRIPRNGKTSYDTLLIRHWITALIQSQFSMLSPLLFRIIKTSATPPPSKLVTFLCLIWMLRRLEKYPRLLWNLSTKL